MWTLELDLVDEFVEVAPVARPGHPRVCGRKKSPEAVPILLVRLFKTKYWCFGESTVTHKRITQPQYNIETKKVKKSSQSLVKLIT
jgi:hypothetical protein